MNPHLQFMAGPLLRYDTVDEYGVWNGAALIVSTYLKSFEILYGWGLINIPLVAADSGSIYEPHPMLKYSWDPDLPAKNVSSQTMNKTSTEPLPVDLGPHPADPHSITLPVGINGAEGNGQPEQGPNTLSQTVHGQEIWVYVGHGGWIFATIFILFITEIFSCIKNLHILAFHDSDPIGAARDEDKIQHQ
jgi:hypothetical protein